MQADDKRGLLVLFIYTVYRKIPNISTGAYIFQRSFLRGLPTEGNLCFKIDWASLIVGSNFNVFALFYFLFAGNFPSTSPRGAYIWRVDLTEGFLGYQFGGLYMEGLIFGILRYIYIPLFASGNTFIER